MWSARKPQRRTVVEPVERGTIRDRFNIPLALNKIQYNAAVCYADIRHIPTPAGRKTQAASGCGCKSGPSTLQSSSPLGEELAMDPQKLKIQSMIPSPAYALCQRKPERAAALSAQDVREGLTGIHMERGSKRCYPLGKTASDVIGCRYH